MTPLKLRTAIYARVSTLDQDPAMQLRDMRARTRTILVTRDALQQDLQKVLASR